MTAHRVRETFYYVPRQMDDGTWRVERKITHDTRARPPSEEMIPAYMLIRTVSIQVELTTLHKEQHVSPQDMEDAVQRGVKRSIEGLIGLLLSIAFWGAVAYFGWQAISQHTWHWRGAPVGTRGNDPYAGFSSPAPANVPPLPTAKQEFTCTTYQDCLSKTMRSGR